MKTLESELKRCVEKGNSVVAKHKEEMKVLEDKIRQLTKENKDLKDQVKTLSNKVN